MESFGGSDRWAWCYLDETYIEAPAYEPPMERTRGIPKTRSA